MNFNKLILLLSTIVLAFGLQSCDNTGCMDAGSLDFDPDATEDNGKCTYPQLTLNMNPVVDGQALNLNEVYSINGVNVSFATFNYYVTNPRLAKDGVVESSDKYLLVTADQTSYDLGEFTVGHKHMLMFAVGVDSTTNHANPEDYETGDPLGFQTPSMHWSWDKGYIFLRIDGMVDTDNDGTPETTMEFHIGKDSNLENVALEVHAEALESNVSVDLNVDLAKLFTGINLSLEYVTHTGDGPELAKKIADNIPSMFSKK